jgi:tetratricopeptide (TPR) repeat protein
MMPIITAIITTWFLFLFVVPGTGVAQSEANDESVSQASEQDRSEEAPVSSSSSFVERDSKEPQEQTISSAEEPKDESTETPQQREQFRRALIHIQRAEALFGSDNYEAALAEYEQAYDVLQGHPKQFQTLHNIGLCHERLFRYGQALRYFEDYLDKGGAQAANRAEVERVIQTLTRLLCTLRILVNVEADVWVDEVSVGHAPGDVLVAAGRHTVELRSPGYESAKLEVSISAQKIEKISFTLKRPDADKVGGIHPAYFWTTSMLSVVALSVGSYFGIEYISRREEVEKHLYENIDERKSDINASETRANVAFIIGGTMGLAAITLFFLTDWDSEETPSSEQKTRQRARLNADISTRGAFMGLNAHF